MSLGLAFRAFFATLFDKQAAQRIRAALTESSSQSTISSTASSEAALASSAKPAGTPRSEALTFVSALQREARFLDLVQEPLEGYSDAQVGAAARDVLRDTAKTLNRFFGIVKLVDSSEGAQIELPPDASSARWRFIGPRPSGSRATLVHAGWKATQCSIPQWTGRSEDALVFAPAEVEA